MRRAVAETPARGGRRASTSALALWRLGGVRRTTSWVEGAHRRRFTDGQVPVGSPEQARSREDPGAPPQLPLFLEPL